MFEIILDTMVIKMNKGIKSKEVKKKTLSSMATTTITINMIISIDISDLDCKHTLANK